MYLEMGSERSVSGVAKKSGKSISLIHRWSIENNWSERAAAWDNSLVRELRRTIKQRYIKALERQWQANEKLQIRITQALERKDIDKISWKSLNDMYRSNLIEMHEIAEKLGAGADTDSNITINITSDED